MLNSKKLLYILPDVVYVAELLPTKKKHDFSVQSFRQINGEFIDENSLIPENVSKLVSKLEPEEYHLILPDFLFTNTIVEVKEKTESGVKEHIKSKLLPDLKISKDSHEVSTNTLNSHGGKTRVQLSALEKVVLQPLREAAKAKKVKIAAVSPLSWTVKSVVSLEPSITVVQIGSKLYLAQHYIGVDQCVSKDISEIEAIAETIKTLKGAEPSIQTVYLLSNPLVEKQLKDLLSDTVPMQQLTSNTEDEEGLPSFVRQIIESSSKTLDIKDFPVPKFSLGKSVSPMPNKSPKPNSKELEEVKKTDSPIDNVEIFEDEEKKPDENTQLPKPTEPEAAEKTEAAEEVVEPAAETTPEPVAEPAAAPAPETEVTPTDEVNEATPEAEEMPAAQEEAVVEEVKVEEVASEDSKPDIEQFAASSNDEAQKEDKDETKKENPAVEEKEEKEEKEVIKNKAGGNLPKMLFITLSVFFITVAIGIGIGLTILQLSKDSGDDAPAAIEEVQETPEPTPEATPEPVTIDKSEYSILIVNATTTSGYAGKIKALLDEDDYEKLAASNAKGEYDEASYLLLAEENDALLEILSEETSLDLVYDEDLDKDTEDAKASYDAVIVLAESSE